MSLRHLKKVFDSENPLAEVGASSSEEEVPEACMSAKKAGKNKKKQAVRNKFELLAEQENESNDDLANGKAAEATNTTEESDSNMKINRRKQKRRKKKKNQKTSDNSELQATRENQVRESEGAEAENSSSATPYPSDACENSLTKSSSDDMVRFKKYEELFEIDPKMLNPEYELKRIFGSKVINHERASGGRYHNRRNLLYRRGRLVYPKDRRISNITAANGITLAFLSQDSETGYKLFKFNHSPSYREIQKQFIAAVDTLNPDSILSLLRTYPYHIDAHIQLSDMAKHSEDMQIASELVEDGINYLQNTFGHDFDICSATCQLPYKYQENRSFHILLFKYLVFLGQRGCPCTALQLCKKLLSLDPRTDSLGVTLMMDFYALKAGENSWLCNLYEFWNTERNLNQLPNWAYSVALAYFMRRNESQAEAKQNKSGNSQMNSSSSAAVRENWELKSNELLQYALLMFPSVLLPLLDKCGIQSNQKVINHWYFNSSISKKQTKSLNLLCDLYVWRSHHVWRDPSILHWLEFNTEAVLSQIESDRKITNDFTAKRQRRYIGTPYNILRHVILTDSKDITIPLPPLLAKKPILNFDPITPADGIDIYNYQRNESTRPNAGGSNSILSMLFRSLVFDLNAGNEPRGPLEAGGNQLGRMQVAQNNNNNQANNQLGDGDEVPVRDGSAAAGGGLAGIQDSVTNLLHAMRDLLQTVNPTGAANEEPNSSEDSDGNDEWD